MNGKMKDTILRLYVKLQTLATGNEGQDLVEYGLLCTLIALALIASISQLGAVVSNAFTNISSSVA